MITPAAMSDVLASAQRRVRIIGVVPLDPEWERIASAWGGRLEQGLEVEILCESDNQLFNKAVTSDSDRARDRRSFDTLKFVRDRAFDLPRLAGGGAGTELLRIQIIHIPIPMSVVEVDGRLFFNMWLHEVQSDFQALNATDSLHDFVVRYVDAFFDPSRGRKYAAEVGAEILELFDHHRTPRGMFPRSSFYDTDYAQLVVWALIFDRRGRLLIHRRASNAKDNRDMWDKSVGGHVDFAADTETSRAVVREVVEELFDDEVKKGKVRKMNTWAATDNEIIYLGEWRPDQRRRYPFDELNEYGREWAFFRLRKSQHLYSPRIMPRHERDSPERQRRLWVIADVFLFVTGRGFDDESLGELENSEFKLIELADLKNAIDLALRGEEVRLSDGENFFDPQSPVPRFSPDLTNIMTGELRGVLESFAQHVKRYVTER
jgi:hypothetical protein